MEQQVYDLIAIGGGAAGMSAAGIAVEMGARVALIERDQTGGDCTWTGCVPSKTLLRSAKVAHTAKNASNVGIEPTPSEVHFDEVMARVHETVQTIYEEESPAALREMGMDVFMDEARFVGKHSVAVGDQVLHGRVFVLATGARPMVPPIEGIDGVHYTTSDTIWNLESHPGRMVIIGGGPIGCEMAQAWQRLGSEVTLIEAGDRLLSHDDAEAGELMAEILRSEGVEVRLGQQATKVHQAEDGLHIMTSQGEVVADTLLLAVGRTPNVEALDLERVGVKHSGRGGIEVDDHLRTSQPHIYAAGDCLGHFMFTHYAGWQGRTAARNALVPGVQKGRRQTVPWTTFTEPEVAHAGMPESAARDMYGDAVEVVMVPIEEVDRARAEEDTRGFIKVVHKGGKVLGVTIVSARAGESINEWVHVLDGRLSLMDVASTIHVYPTYAQTNEKAAQRVLGARLRGGAVGKAIKGLSSAALGWMRWWHASGKKEA